jgi:sulfoxide reductase heme-binding subunit YedZ
MITPVVASVGHGYTALWYLTRASGLVSLVLLSATVVLGIVSSVGWTTERWPRFLSQSMHRNLSLFCIGFVALHVVTTVADGYVPIGFLDAVIPFQTPYRPLWVGFGALTLDLLLAVAITSGLRKHIGVRAWRGVHWLAYLCWPIALLHGLGSGSDTRLSLALMVNVVCVVAVVGAVGWRLVTGRTFSPGRRIVAAVVGGVGLTAIGITAALGPLRPGWSHRAGTSAALLTQLNASFASGGTSSSAASTPAASAPAQSNTAPSTNDAVPVPPFTRTVAGTYRTSAANQSGQVSVVLSMTPSGTPATPLTVTITGASVNGGVAMSSSQVTWGQDTGSVTALQGSTIGATVKGPHGSVQLSMRLNLDRAQGTVSGTLTGSTTNGTG